MTLANKETGEILPIMENPEEMAAITKENLQGEEISPDDLDTIKIPSGGQLNWTLPDGTTPKIIDAVIIANRRTRSYWKESYDVTGGGTRPDCKNDDLSIKPNIGIGNPGGPCATCPFDVFGSAPPRYTSDGTPIPSDGKACREIRLLFILRPGEELPEVIPATPGSLRPVRAYFVALWKKRLIDRHVFSRIALEEEHSRGAGIKFSKILMMPEFEVLPPELKVRADERFSELEPVLYAKSVGRDEVDGPSGGPPMSDAPNYGHHHVVYDDDVPAEESSGVDFEKLREQQEREREEAERYPQAGPEETPAPDEPLNMDEPFTLPEKVSSFSMLREIAGAHGWSSPRMQAELLDGQPPNEWMTNQSKGQKRGSPSPVQQLWDKVKAAIESDIEVQAAPNA